MFGFVPDTFEMFERLTGLELPAIFGGCVRGELDAERKAHLERCLPLYELEGAIDQQIRSFRTV